MDFGVQAAEFETLNPLNPISAGRSLNPVPDRFRNLCQPSLRLFPFPLPRMVPVLICYTWRAKLEREF